MLIAAPGDPMEVGACMRYLVKNPQPSYLRLGKAGEPLVHTEVPEVLPGKWLRIRDGGKGRATYLTTGTTLSLVNQLLAKNPKLDSFSLRSMPLWSMKAKVVQPPQVENFESVITVEDHLMDGGFGSWFLEATSIRPDLLTSIKIKALDSEVCDMVARQSTMNAQGGLTEEMLCE